MKRAATVVAVTLLVSALPALAVCQIPGNARPAHTPVGSYYGGWVTDAPDVLYSYSGDNAVIWKDITFSAGELAGSNNAMLVIGSDDGAQAWVNGVLVVNDPYGAHGVGYWNYYADVYAHLSEGRNRLVIRVYNSCQGGSGEGGLDYALYLGNTTIVPAGSGGPVPANELWYDGGDCGWVPELDSNGLEFTHRDYGCTDDVVAAVDQPRAFQLAPAFPNPFNPATTLEYSLAATGAARLSVHDLAGREVALLADGLQEAGAHQVVFDAAALPSGVYFARLEADGRVATQKLLLVK